MSDEMTLREIAEMWWREQGNKVPAHGTAAWKRMYEEWIEFAFGPEE